MDTNGVIKKYKIKIKNPVMGVPITFLDKYCPTQFEIVGWSRHNDLDMDGGYWLGGCNDATINGKIVYRRILIRRKKAEPIVEVETTDNK